MAKSLVLVLPARLSEDELKAVRYRTVEQMDVQEFVVAEPQAEYERVEPQRQKFNVSDAAFRFFTEAAKNWFRKLTEIYKLTKVGTDGTALCDELRLANLVRVMDAKTFRPGNQISFLLPTAQGMEILQNAKAEYMKVHGDVPAGTNGTHIWYQNRIVQHFRKRKDWVVRIEMTRESKSVDVGVLNHVGEYLAYEVVNEGLDKELENVKKDLADGWDSVVLCVGTAEIMGELRKLVSSFLGQQVLQKVEFEMLPRFNN